MKSAEIEKLLGGYAAGILTAEERRVLFEAAMEDQELFDSLAREQPLKDLLDDANARAALRRSLEEPSAAQVSWLQSPVWRAFAGGFAAACLLVAIAWQLNRPSAPRVEERQIAQFKAPPPAAAETPATPSPAPVPEKAKKRVEQKAEAPKSVPAAIALEAAPPSVPQPMREVAVAGGVGGAAPAVSSEDAAVSRRFAPPVRALSSMQVRISAEAPPVRVTVLRKSGENEFLANNPSQPFHAGDEIRLALDATSAGQFTIFRDGTELLSGQAIAPGSRYLYPASGAIRLTEQTVFRITFRATAPDSQPFHINLPLSVSAQ